MNRLAITEIVKGKTEYLAYIMLDEKRDFVDFQLYEKAEKTRLNDIVIARVENILPNINAAFVRISENERCFLPFGNIKSPVFTKKQSKKKELSIGDELLVQVERDAVKTKEAVVTTRLTLSGTYSVLTTDNESLGVSKKIPDEKRQTLQSQLQEWMKEETDRNYGIVIRTNAAKVQEEKLQQDVGSLIQKYHTMIDTAVHKNAFTQISKNPPGYISRLKSTDFQKIDQIYTDSKEIFHTIQEELPNIQDRLVLYQDEKLSLHALYNIEGNIDRLLAKRIWLKSGANIIIEQLETLTVVDVNTGKNISGKTETLFKVNMEAAAEVARQLRLRNISGMIIVDFINMDTKEKDRQLMEMLKQEVAKDPVRCSVIDITKLGLVEITRKKVYRSLKEILETK